MLEQIKRIFEQSRGCYGSRRIQAELRTLGIPCNRKRVSRIMRENGMQAKQRRRYKTTTRSNNNKPVAANLVNRNFEAQAANKIWVSDITYIWTKEGWQ